MRILHSLRKRVLPLSATRHYRPEEVLAMCRGCDSPFWLEVEGHLIRIDEWATTWVAAQAVAHHHNAVCCSVPPDDGWAEDTARAEAEARAHMEAESSEDEEYVTSEEDIDFSQHYQK